ncbi:hypothetical protein [Streptomyces virginiae]|uniref:hypothetical protein n=1 Tax=Streptomyces virginiae TaxID=1961 RepID=UPI00224FCBF5|nr:hypothetical protein [Streptomyces virginiae]MCX4721569.1 hypothetical protein [Streptomyces virginiae]MCX5276901.1 hypothetical protein [Streptomyces virginiae]
MAVRGSQSSFTAWLPPGPYLILEYQDFEGPYIGRNPLPGGGYVSPLLVHTADDTGVGRPRPSATVTAVDTARGSRFVLEGHLRRDRPLRYVNAMPEQVDELAVYPPH